MNHAVLHIEVAGVAAAGGSDADPVAALEPAAAQRCSDIKRINSPSLEAFRDVPLIRFYNEGLDRSIDKLFMTVDFMPLVVAKSVSSIIYAELCAAGVGYMIVPDGWAYRRLGPKIEVGEMLLFRLPYHYPSPRMILSYPAGKHLTEEEPVLIDMIREHVNRL